MKLKNKLGRSIINLYGVLAVALCWGVGGPLSYIVTRSVPAAETTFARCFFAFLFVSPFFILDAKIIFRDLKTSGKLLIISSGLTLGVHFFLFVSGVVYASLATAVLLVAVEPVLILLVGVLGFKEKLRTMSFFGVLFSIIGILIISLLPHIFNPTEFSTPSRTYGDLCAILAVVAYGIYYALNRAFKTHETQLLQKVSPLRRSFSLASIIYLFASISSGIIVFINLLRGAGISIFPANQAIVGLLGMGLIPTVFGHTLNQIVSRTAHPVWVSLMSPGETLIAIFLGYLFLGQNIGIFEIIGGCFILFGVAITIIGERNS